LIDISMYHSPHVCSVGLVKIYFYCYFYLAVIFVKPAILVFIQFLFVKF